MEPEREKALDTALGQIEKQFGKGSVMKMGEKTTMNIEAISTGALALDLALGIGGLPRGRVTEIFGPEASGKSTLATHVVAEAQRNGGVCAYIDAEHAMDPIYARAIGVDIDELLISQPDTGEQALEIADMLIRSSALDVVVIDSVAALTPRAEIEGEMGDSHVGLQARLMSQALRKLTSNLNKSKTICIFINQLREKIGVMFGCLSYATRVTLADGTQEKIGKIVNQRMPVEVLSYDPELDQIVPRKVVNWFDNGRTDSFLRFTVAKPRGNGRAQFSCTPNHLIRTPGGWREAGELAAGDRVMQSITHRLSDFQRQIVLGGLMGDGALSPSRSGHSARFRWGHGAKQAGYGDWKASLFENLSVSRSTNANGAIFHDVQPLVELAELRRAVYQPTGKHLSVDYLKALTPLALAIWYQDDGCFTKRAKDGTGRSEICVQAFTPATRQRLRDHLAETWGINGRLVSRGAREQSFISFPKDETTKLHALIAPYVHPSMDYKLIERFRGRFEVQAEFIEPVERLVPMPITRIENKPPNGRQTHRFDIEVEGSHNYFADGVMVHNSPETTPGGRALKFYSSVRLDIRRIESIKDGVEVVGNRTRVKVVKNKCLGAGSRVFDPIRGVSYPIEDIVERGLGESVVAADKSGQLHIRPIGERMVQGEQEVIGLRLRDGTELWLTPDHRVLTADGWVEAGDLTTDDRVARPRFAVGFGVAEPITPDQARLLGQRLGNDLAPTKRIPAALFDPEVSPEVVANLIFGVWETDGWVSREQTGAVRLGFSTTSEQLAQQLHWQLLRWGIGSSVRVYDPHQLRPSSIGGRRVQGTRPGWEVRISGADNVERFAEAIPMWGPKGLVLTRELGAAGSRRRRGSQRGYLPASQNEPVRAYLRHLGVSPAEASRLIGDIAGNPSNGLGGVLGMRRIRRDRLTRLADALDSRFLHDILADELWYDRVVEVMPPERRMTYDIEVAELHNFVADDVVVHNCAPPFRQAEFDIMYGHGISREGSVLDLAVDESIVKKSGAWYTYDGEQLGQGRENAKKFLQENPEVMVEIADRVWKAVRPEAEAAPDAEDAAEGEGDQVIDLTDAFSEEDDLPISIDD